jgi:hypothetical protein
VAPKTFVALEGSRAFSSSLSALSSARLPSERSAPESMMAFTRDGPRMRASTISSPPNRNAPLARAQSLEMRGQPLRRILTLRRTKFADRHILSNPSTPRMPSASANTPGVTTGSIWSDNTSSPALSSCT